MIDIRTVAISAAFVVIMTALFLAGLAGGMREYKNRTNYMLVPFAPAIVKPLQRDI